MPGYGWNNGYYYDCGPGGNVVYQNGQVQVDGQAVGTDAEYAQSAAELANVDLLDAIRDPRLAGEDARLARERRKLVHPQLHGVLQAEGVTSDG